MLSKKQLQLLKIIASNTECSGSCLLSAPIISQLCLPSVKISDEEVEKIILSLAVKGYIDVINTFKRQEPFYCISLTSKGKNFQVEHKEDIKEVRFKLTLAVIGAVLSFLVGRILFILFT